MFKKGSRRFLPILFALVCTLCLVFALAGCGHTHEYSETLVQGETQHWYECECGKKFGAADHIYQNGVCAVCGKVDPSHPHDFNTPWVQGATQHYHQCAACDEIQDAADHTYQDAVCSVCGKKDPSHIHDFDVNWTQGATQHWRKCIGCDETWDAGDHTYVNGVCSVCEKEHAHEFGTTWTPGDAKHYHVCKGCDLIKDEEAHVYLDGVCKCGKEHPHEFETEWTQGDEKHYHACKGCDAVKDAEEHDYLNGVCVVCDYWHRHEYTSEWTITDARHSRECSGCDYVWEKGFHDYENGTCTVCYKEHEHEYSSSWTRGNTEHWHICIGCDLIQGKEGHEYMNGKCKVCGKEQSSAQAGSYSYPDNVLFGSDVFVHDPAIFLDPKSGQYFAFGSHFAVASSSDLITWQQYTYDHQPYMYWNDDWKTELAQGYAHVGEGCESTWAPDLHYHDGKYYMYVSLSTFGNTRSAIVRVEADFITGYYTNEQVIVTSTYGDNANCIDPQVFSDQEGGLWLVYGSFFGGIYLKELYNDGPNWGLPKESGFGTLLWKGQAPSDAAQGGPEGPFVFYRNGYYYLMVSDGSLSSNYHMRVARSTAPQGPYVDITGADMAAAHGKGNKLAGNWRFDGEGGNAAYGHNSVLELDGEFYVVGHMRYEENGGVSSYHSVRVHRLLFNEDGWPVLAPERYAGEKLGNILESELVGDYDLILHDEARSAGFVTSSRYTLMANHTVTRDGTQCGTWSYKAAGNFIEITIGGVTYKGAAMPVWTSGGGAIAFSAVSPAGRSLWAKGAASVRDPALEVVYQASGNAKNTAVPKFYTADGFTLSFRVSGVGNDWLAVVLDILGMRITLPNIDTAFNTAGFPLTNCFPWGAGANQPGFDYNCYQGGNYYVTISVSKTGGICFYRDGVLTQYYEPSDEIYRIGQELSLERVRDFVDALSELIADKGFTFVPATFVSDSGNGTANSIESASDLIVSRGAADSARAKAIYTYYGQY